MIRLIQRRLIIPRGDTGTFTVPALSPGQSDSVGVFTIFDPITKTRVFQKQVELQDGVFNIEFDHGDTVNLQAGDYLWDIKFYVNPIIENGKVIDGTEIDSYYAAFQTPKCEIRETGDDFMVIDGQPAKIEDLNIILAATSAANAAKVAATEQAEIAATKASEAAERLEQMIAAIPTKVSELENDSGYLQEETDPTVPAWAKAQTKPSYTPQEVGALPSDTFIPSKVSDLTDDSGHYTKPASGIPASDLEETYLTEHQDLSNYVQKTDYASVDEAGIIKVMNTDVNAARESQAGGSVLINGKLYYIGANAEVQYKVGANLAALVSTANQHLATFYGLAKAAGSNERDSELPVGQYTDAAKAAIQQMLGVPSAADIPTNVSELTNDAGYLTEHQDISGKANSADLAAVATSGSYNDLEDKPFIPSKVSDLTDDSGHYTKPVGGIPASDLAETYLTSFTEIDPTVPSWAKEPNKPAYTAAEVNAVNKTGDTMTGALTLPYINQSYRNALRFATNADAHEMGINARYDENYDYGYFTVSSELKSGFTKDAIIRGVKNPRYSNDAANKEYVDNKISTAIGNINSFDMAVVQELPTQDISTHTIYLVPKTGETNDVYDEYVYINDAWEMVGNTQIDLSNYVQKTDYATVDNAGVVKVSSTFGIGIDDNDKKLYINKATSTQIKSGKNAYASIVPANQHESAFYALAKAAGDATQSQSNNAVGIYTDEAKAAIQTMLDVPAKSDIPDVPVEDVQANGTSILNNGIANIPVATKYDNATNPSRLGLVNIGQGLNISAGGMLTTSYASTSEIKGETSYYSVITPKNVNVGVFYGLAKAAGDTTQSQSNNTVGTYTETAKGAIQKMLGITDLIAPEENDLVANQAYAIGDVFIANGKLYKATAAIAVDAAIIPAVEGEEITGANCVETSVGEGFPHDVQVNGESVVSDGVANIPLASKTNAGAVKVGNGFFISPNNPDILNVDLASLNQIKNGDGNSSVRASQIAEIAFYGLAKAAGANEKNSTLPAGQYTDTAKGAIRGMLGATSSNVIAVQDTQPTDTDTKIWLPETAPEGVEVPTMEDLGDYVKKTDYASNNAFGITKANLGAGIGVDSVSTTLYINRATSTDIKTGEHLYKPIVPYFQHESVYYGLSKLAGVDLASETVTVGTYPATASAAIRSLIGAGEPLDVQVNGTSVVSNGVANIPLASVNEPGAVKIGSNNGVIMQNDVLVIECAPNVRIKAANTYFMPIVPGNQHISTFYGLATAAGDTTQKASSNAVGSYTDNAKASIKAMLGIQDGSTGTVDITGTTPTITAVENTRYVCGEVTSLNFTPPTSGISIVRFTSGSTVTVLTIPSTVKFPEWFDPTSLETNTIYEICVTDGVYGAVMSWAL